MRFRVGGVWIGGWAREQKTALRGVGAAEK